jgi:hypothetical protein
MDIKILAQTFFTEDDIKSVFNNIRNSEDDGQDLYRFIEEFKDPLTRISDYINKLQDQIYKLSVTAQKPVLYIPLYSEEVAEKVTETGKKLLRETMDMFDIDVTKLVEQIEEK